MTDGDYARLEDELERALDPDSEEAWDRGHVSDPGGLLAQARSTAVRLVSESGGSLRSMVVRAGPVALELNWADSAPAEASAPADPVRATAAPDVPIAGSDPELTHVCAPLVGVFYLAPGPDQPPFVRVGDTVASGQQVGIVEAMKLMVPVEATTSGIVTEMPVADAESVEYGQALLAVRPVEQS
ncbi:acetyl-CoA carboxylase biotin carboxyl carrier protein [Saccharopolyspora lacisalsi]|uniref:Biotin carboxyl carrier protein of acetyl-CoA carboxylase n=1 Tax=Halosaccharopolyspora lacisalsi TaxID=1000566 RepID=A0A839E4E2_9PSEU|nr:biotin/lipoyl-containing protein [Halosaccharopolyspora lacisalsi]MBA8826221.1 acetyl-CoA carboxylase biotin carboxyl carrier protein [Halosaccharopolyspora lacisalsi]